MKIKTMKINIGSFRFRYEIQSFGNCIQFHKLKTAQKDISK